MMKYTAVEIAAITGGSVSDGGNAFLAAEYAFSDSREYRDGTGLYIAIPGARCDGHEFVAEMTAKGNLALIENSAYAMPGTILVENTVRALCDLAEHYRLTELNSVKVVAITGSVGKTGTKDMTALAVGAGKSVFKTPGNRNSLIGLPQIILSVPTDTDVAVIEVGISEKDEMWRLSKVVRPDIAMLTNIGYSHIEAFGSREGIRDEKLQIISYMRDGGMVIFNGDEPLLSGVIDKNHRCVCCALVNTGCCCRAENIRKTDFGVTFDAKLWCDTVEVTLGVSGSHNACNAMFALAAARTLDVDLNAAAAALAGFKQSGMRQNISEHDGMTIIADCYNASPESMHAALTLLSGASGRKVAVLGDMLELGSFAPELHAAVGKECASIGCDLLVTVGTLARGIAASAQGVPSFCFDEGGFEEAAECLRRELRAGDTVLFKASNRMELGKLIGIIKGE